MPRQKTTVKEETKTRSSGLSADVLNTEGKAVGKIDLPKSVFAAKVSPQLMAQAVRVYLANHHQGTASTKTRGEVAGTTKKTYRQKGTGHARHGSLKAPIYVGGGIAFGPQPHDFGLKLPQRMRKTALFSALTSKFNNNDIIIVDELEKSATKTNALSKILQNLEHSEKKKLTLKTLLVPPLKNNLNLVSRNIENLTLIPVNLLNTYEVLSNEKIIFTKEAIANFLS